MPELGFRIGLDSGEAIITDIGAEGIKSHKDLIGETVSLASKIQSRAKNKQILLGESTTLNVQTFWRKKLKRLDSLKNWDYSDKKTGKVYALYYLVQYW